MKMDWGYNMSERIVAYKLNIHNGDKIYLGFLKDAECYYIIENGKAIRKRFEFLKQLDGLTGAERFNMLRRLCLEIGYDVKYITYEAFIKDNSFLKSSYLDRLEENIIKRRYKEGGVKDIRECAILKYTDIRLKGYEHTSLHMHNARKCIEKVISNKLRSNTYIDDIIVEVNRNIKIMEVEKKKLDEVNTLRLINDINYFVTKIETPTYERETGNKNKKTFDFVRVFVNLPSPEVVDKEAIRIGLNTHYREICNMVLDKIASMKNYQRFGVPVTALKLSKAVVEYRCNRVMFIFELKDELRNIMQEQG